MYTKVPGMQDPWDPSVSVTCLFAPMAIGALGLQTLVFGSTVPWERGPDSSSHAQKILSSLSQLTSPQITFLWC